MTRLGQMGKLSHIKFKRRGHLPEMFCPVVGLLEVLVFCLLEFSFRASGGSGGGQKLVKGNEEERDRRPLATE